MTADLRNNSVIPYIYPVDIALDANALGSVNVTLAADSWFELRCFRATVNNADSLTDTNPDYFSCMITDAGTGRSLQSTKVRQSILTGNAFRSVDEKRAIKFAPNTTLQFDFQNLIASGITVQFALVGYKWFNLGNR